MIKKRLRWVTVDPELIQYKYELYRRAYEVLDKGTSSERAFVKRTMKKASFELMNKKQVRENGKPIHDVFFGMIDRIGNAQ